MTENIGTECHGPIIAMKQSDMTNVFTGKTENIITPSAISRSFMFSHSLLSIFVRKHQFCSGPLLDRSTQQPKF
jgi:hypothetical protein